MRPGRPLPLTLTRRALRIRLAQLAAANDFGQSAATSVAARRKSPSDLKLHEVTLPGLALASHRSDPLAAEKAETTLARPVEIDPDARTARSGPRYPARISVTEEGWVGWTGGISCHLQILNQFEFTWSRGRDLYD